MEKSFKKLNFDFDYNRKQDNDYLPNTSEQKVEEVVQPKIEGNKYENKYYKKKNYSSYSKTFYNKLSKSVIPPPLLPKINLTKYKFYPMQPPFKGTFPLPPIPHFVNNNENNNPFEELEKEIKKQQVKNIPGFYLNFKDLDDQNKKQEDD